MLWKYSVPCHKVSTTLYGFSLKRIWCVVLLWIQSNSGIDFPFKHAKTRAKLDPSYQAVQSTSKISSFKCLIREKSPACQKHEQSNPHINCVQKVKDCCVMSLGLFQTTRDRVNFPNSRGKMRYLHRRSNSLIKSSFIAEQIEILSALGHNEALSSQ